MSNLITLKPKKPRKKWFHFSQSNSGGYFIINDVVAEDVFVQARSAEQAEARASAIFAPYSEFCECCSKRWSYGVHKQDGRKVPTKYNEPVTEIIADLFHTQARLHHLDGTVETVFYKPQLTE
jgi:hypothetical protein